jgi:hypothetical protein
VSPAVASVGSRLAIMRRLDRLHLEFPFAGSRMLRGLLVAEGYKIGRRHGKTLMRRMGTEVLYRRPRTTRPEPGHKIYRICCAASRSHGQTRCGRWTCNSPVDRKAALRVFSGIGRTVLRRDGNRKRPPPLIGWDGIRHSAAARSNSAHSDDRAHGFRAMASTRLNEMNG